MKSKKSLLFLFLFSATIIHSYAQGVHQLWGTTIAGGTEGGGTIFSLKADGTGFVKRYDFKTEAQGHSPLQTEFLEYNNKYYGVTSEGGPYLGGILFEWDPLTNNYTKKADFVSATGCFSPYGILALFNNKIYGLAEGGVNGAGAIFEYDLMTNVLQKKFDFTNSTGSQPRGGVMVFNNKLYGTTRAGGIDNQGVVYTYDLTNNIYTVIKSFSNTDGIEPVYSNVLSVFNNKLYGVVVLKPSGSGVAIFEIDPVTNSYQKKLNFTGSGGNPYPIGSLSAFSGKLYGMTTDFIYEYDPAINIVTIKYNFPNLNEGTTPSCAKLILYNNKFYGATKRGGVNYSGVLFEWDPAANSYTKKGDFTRTDEVFTGLTLNNNILYGLQGYSGPSNFGLIFKFDLINSQLTTQVNFLSGLNGVLPVAGLQYSNNKLYGATTGGTNNSGIIYEYDYSTSTYLKKKDFESGIAEDFFGLRERLIPYNNRLYVVVNDNLGKILEWDPATNTTTIKVQFSSSGSLYLNGFYPVGQLVLFNGKFYGTTNSGGANWAGTIFEWDPATNIFSKKYDFSYASGAGPTFITLKNSKFYGTTSQGGLNDNGVIFEWDPSTNIYTKKLDFSAVGGVTAARGGPFTEYNEKFYGLEGEGGLNNLGFLYEWDPVTNVFTKKVDFSGSGSYNPVGKLTLSNGKLYGSSNFLGADDTFNYGTLFEWDPVNNTISTKHNFNGLDGAVTNGFLEIAPALIARGNPNACTSLPSITINSSNNNEWVAITNQFGDVVAEIKANGNNLGAVSTSVYSNSGPTREDANKKLYLDRSFTITPQTQPNTPVDIRLYITEAEFNALKNATNSQGQPSGINSINDIDIFKNGDACNNQIIAATTQVNTTNIVYNGGGYIITGAVNSFSSFYFANKTGGPLPLTLLSFSSKLRNNNTELEWKTANEYNTDEFVVQRSTDGRYYQNIGTVKANNNSGTHSYQFTDIAVNRLGKQVLYYRLLQKDINSKQTYSNITSVTFGFVSDVIQWPNPVTNQLNLLFTTVKKEKISIRIIDINGRVKKLEEFFSEKGSIIKSYDLSNFEKGNYIVEVYSNSIKKQFKIIKQ